MTTFTPDESPRGLTREDVMKAAEVAALFAVPVSTVLHWGRTGVLRWIKLGRHVRFLRADIERLVRDQDEDGVT
jgi:excisionase family DNA binding protein